jgi:hypothetical protein
MTTAAEPSACAPITPRAASACHPTLSSALASAPPRVLARLPDVGPPSTAKRMAVQAMPEQKPAFISPRRLNFALPNFTVPAWLSHKVALVAVAAVALAVLIASTRNRDQHARRLDSPPAWNGQVGQPVTDAIPPTVESFTVAQPPVVSGGSSTSFTPSPLHDHSATLQADRRNGAPAPDTRSWASPEPVNTPSSKGARASDTPPEMPVRFPTAGARRQPSPPGVPRVEYNRFAPPDHGQRHVERDSYEQPRVSRRYEEIPRARFDGTIRTPSFPSQVTPHDDARSVFH